MMFHPVKSAKEAAQIESGFEIAVNCGERHGYGAFAVDYLLVRKCRCSKDSGHDGAAH